tara:strand:+ start:165 stop:1016 length:852 start_codon:yes stop_codon:yes gene_type:complete
MLTYIVYSHTSFIDALKVQTHYLNSYENKILLVNKSDEDFSDLYSNYKEVIFYDDTLPYATRLLELKRLELDYVLFIHDIDVVINRNDSTMEYMLDEMKKLDVDRFDLQYQNIRRTGNTTGHLIDIDLKPTGKAELKIPHGWENPKDLRFYLTKQDDVNFYIYNVNPSIWKMSVFMEIMTHFKNETYRSIENQQTMQFCKKYNIYKFYGPHILCGGMGCLPFFQFIHITHGGKLLPYPTGHNLDESLVSVWESILTEFSLDSKREFQTRNYEDYWKGPIRDQR